jgi:plastocyanin
MRRWTLAAAVATTLAVVVAPTSASAQSDLVTIAGSAFHPVPIAVLVGEPVTWRNQDFLAHQVTADDGGWGSARLARGDAYAHAFATAGRFTYSCAIHPFMHGEVDAAPILLEPPPGPVLLGASTTLRGRAQAGVTTVALAREGASGPPTLATVAADGTFAARVRLDAPGRWRASAGALASPPVTVAVATLQRVLVRAAGDGLSVRTAPPRPGARIVVERYWRERFAWRVVARARLDRRGRAFVPLQPAARAPGRLQAVLPPAGALPRSVGRVRLG